MNKLKYTLLFFAFCVIVPFNTLKANNFYSKDTISNASLAQYKEDATSLIQFFEFALNTLGDTETSAKDKDVIVSESYSKMFMSDKVQIEDDLDENRNMPINKDVQAYLKDVDFFFKGVGFELTIQDINMAVNDQNQLYFKVTLNRHLKGKTIKGDSVNTNRTRYMEININENTKVLKIVSIYTNKINEKDEWRTWWNALSPEWRLALGANVKLTDALKMAFVWEVGQDYALGKKDTIKVGSDMIESALAQIIYREDLDLSNIKNISDFMPLNKLTRLKRLVLTGTNIANINPIRNMNGLTFLDLSGTKVVDISALRYALNLSNINLSNTAVSDINILSYLSNLEKININNTDVASLKPFAELEKLIDLRCNSTKITNLIGIKSLANLEILNCTNTSINDIILLKNLRKLERLDISNTPISKIDSLSGLSNLKFLGIDNTKVLSLKAIQNLPLIEQVNCDNAPIDKADINLFLQAKPKALVIYESAMLVTWWQKLPEEWKKIFVGINPNLATNTSKEELHKLTGITNLKITGNDKISSLDPLKVFPALKVLTATYLSEIKSIEALSMLKELTELDIQYTKVDDLSPLANSSQLEVLNCSHTPVTNLAPLEKQTKLSRVIIDNTGVSSLYPLVRSKNLLTVLANDVNIKLDSVASFSAVSPNTLVIFRANELNNWWKGLSKDWQKMFVKLEPLDIANPTSEQLHKLCANQIITIDRSLKINSKQLENLKKFYQLKELSIEDQNVDELSNLSKFKFLEVLNAAKNPIKSAEAINTCTKLKVVDLENTPLENLNGFENLKQLTTVKISGTKVSNLEKLKGASKLEILEALNTKIGSIKPIKDIKTLKTLKITSNFWLNYFGGLNSFKKDRKKVDVIDY